MWKFNDNDATVSKSVLFLYKCSGNNLIFDIYIYNTFPAEESTEPLLEARCKSIL